MISFLDLEYLLQAPAGHPASEAEVIQLIRGAFMVSEVSPASAVRCWTGKASVLSSEGARGKSPASWSR